MVAEQAGFVETEAEIVVVESESVVVVVVVEAETWYTLWYQKLQSLPTLHLASVETLAGLSSERSPRARLPPVKSAERA